MSYDGTQAIRQAMAIEARRDEQLASRFLNLEGLIAEIADVSVLTVIALDPILGKPAGQSLAGNPLYEVPADERSALEYGVHKLRTLALRLQKAYNGSYNGDDGVDLPAGSFPL